MIELLENLDTLAVQRAKINQAIGALNSNVAGSPIVIVTVTATGELPSVGNIDTLYHIKPLSNVSILKRWNGTNYTSINYLMKNGIVYFAMYIDAVNYIASDFSDKICDVVVLNDEEDGNKTNYFKNTLGVLTWVITQ